MNLQKSMIVTALFVFGALALSVGSTTMAGAQSSAVDPAATQILKRMTDHLGSLDHFSVRTQITIEDVTDRDHRVDLDVSANVTIDRPDRLLSERRGDPIDQTFYYDGKALTLFNPGENVYATEPAPATIEGLLDYARESLGLIVPVADLVYRNAFDLLMQDVTYAAVVGKSVIDGVTCNHLLFSRPGVDFQVWVADGARALPCKYVVTDTAHPGWVSITTVMSDWDFAPDVRDAVFRFEPPEGARPITFMRSDAPAASSR
jgi:hypothetical protein